MRDVVVNGQVLMRDRELTQVDEAAILAAARAHSARLVAQLD